jgi:hypothetical protein
MQSPEVVVVEEEWKRNREGRIGQSVDELVIGFFKCIRTGWFTQIEKGCGRGAMVKRVRTVAVRFLFGFIVNRGFG